MAYGLGGSNGNFYIVSFAGIGRIGRIGVIYTHLLLALRGGEFCDAVEAILKSVVQWLCM